MYMWVNHVFFASQWFSLFVISVVTLMNIFSDGCAGMCIWVYLIPKLKQPGMFIFLFFLLDFSWV